MSRLPLLGALAWFLCCVGQAAEPVVVGSKSFTESYVLGEIMAQLLEARGIEVERRFGFGGTLICFEALTAGEIDVYPEYTGTISEAILKTDTPLSGDGLAAELAELGLVTLPELGFNNTYAMTVRTDTARELNLRVISDLVPHSGISVGLSHEFRDRADGWPGLKRAYALPQTAAGIEHGLAYQALAEGQIDLTDAYSTDGELIRYPVTVLTDDRGYFPVYRALPLARSDLPVAAHSALTELANLLDDETMRALNARVVIEEDSFAVVAADFLATAGLADNRPRNESGLWPSLSHNIVVHIQLTLIALGLACVAGLLLAVLVYRSEGLSRVVLYVAGLLQTIPSIALLALLIPFAGVGQKPAIIALFLYSLLPIVRNAITALITIDPLLRRVAAALGMTQWQQMRHVHFPLALPHVLAGVRIAAVVSIGTATLAAFIGAGGLGEPIVTGLALNDTSLILQGAIPAALLALATELVFEMIERWLIPAHLTAGRSTL